ncbi:MAG TPA: hypothetical protein VFW98_17180 [Gemmatimonadaceae bacterium]|nr:hypothetical protein [Gemmatimonadaceae bacterium]
MNKRQKKKQGRKLRYNDPAETASREASERARRGEEHIEPTGGAADAAAGTLGGILAGGTTGMLVLGPIGAAVAAIAGALGGWWSTASVTRAARNFTDEEDRYYREYYESLPNRPVDRAYEDVRAAYQLGYVAAHNPTYSGKSFDEIEPELRQAWTAEMRQRAGDWAAARSYVRTAYERKISTPATSGAPDHPPLGDAGRSTGDAEHPDA